MSDPLAEECGTDPIESEPGVDFDSESLLTKREYLCGLGSTNQIAERRLENSWDILITKSGRHSRKPHSSDYMLY